MHPRQQIGIGGGVGSTIRRRPGHVQVDASDPLDQAFGIGVAAERRGGDELPGTPQTAEQVLAKVRVIPYARQRQWVQRLQ